MDVGEDAATTWLPISEAAPRLGMTVDGLRSRIRRGLVTPRKGNDGRLLVPVSTNGAVTGHDRSVDTLDGHGDALDELRAENTELRVTVARLEEQLTAGERRETDLRTAFARERAALEERDVSLTATLAAERARADRLEAALAEARRPLLLRLLEGLRRKGS
jgi:hypothetical protein